jgi:hypothetical protein
MENAILTHKPLHPFFLQLSLKMKTLNLFFLFKNEISLSHILLLFSSGRQMKMETELERARDGESAGDGECQQAGRDSGLSRPKRPNPGRLARIQPFPNQNGLILVEIRPFLSRNLASLAGEGPEWVTGGGRERKDRGRRRRGDKEGEKENEKIKI